MPVTVESANTVNIEEQNQIVTVEDAGEFIELNDGMTVLVQDTLKEIVIPDNRVVVIAEPLQVVEIGLTLTMLAAQFLSKHGDTGDGDYVFEDNVEVDGELTENNANVYTVSQTTRDLYVDSFTGSDSNDGRTIGAPFLTLQKAYEVACYQASADLTIIHANGLFEEEIVIPKYGNHTVKVVGSDLSDPTQAIIKGRLDEPAISTAIDARNSDIKLIFEGVQFKDSFFAIYAQRSNIEFTGCDFDNVSYWVRDNGESLLTLSNSSNYLMQYHGFSGTNFPLLVGRNSTLNISAPIIADTFDRFINLNGDGARLTVTAVQLWTHKAGAVFGPYSIFCTGNVSVNIQASIEADGNNATPGSSTAFLYFSSCHPATTFFLGGITFTLKDFAYAVNSSNQAFVYLSDDVTVHFSLTNVGKKAKLNIGSTAYDYTSIAGSSDTTWQSNLFDSRLSIEKVVTAKTANYTCLPHDQNIPVNTSGGNRTIKLEASPVEGRRIYIIHAVIGNILTIDGNGKNINGMATLPIVNRSGVCLIYSGGEWKIKGNTSRLSDIAITTQTVSNTTTETALYSTVLPANHLFKYHVMDIISDGVISNVSASDDITIRIKFNSIVLATFNAAIGNITNEPWHADLHFTVRNVGASAVIATHAKIKVNGYEEEQCLLNTIDSTVQNTVSITAEWDNAKAGNTISRYQGYTNHKN